MKFFGGWKILTKKKKRDGQETEALWPWIKGEVTLDGNLSSGLSGGHSSRMCKAFLFLFYLSPPRPVPKWHKSLFSFVIYRFFVVFSFLFGRSQSNWILFDRFLVSTPCRLSAKKTPLTLEDPEQEPRCSKCFLLFLFCFSLRVKKRNKSEKKSNQKKKEKK